MLGFALCNALAHVSAAPPGGNGTNILQVAVLANAKLLNANKDSASNFFIL